jgi:kynurenine 3-monooxygenase
MPLYSRVTFSLQPYSEALAIGDRQNEIMEEILKIDKIQEKWNSEEIENLILEKLNAKY